VLFKKTLRNILVLFSFFLFSLSNAQEINKKDSNGKNQGHWIFYTNKASQQNPQKRIKLQEGNYINGRKEGQWIFYYQDGVTPKIKAIFRNNRPYGLYEKYYSNGILKEKGSVVNNLNIDSIMTFHPNGKVEYAAILNIEGKEQGAVKYYYPNGKKEFEYLAINGSPAGAATIFFEDGTIKKKMEYTSSTEVVILEENQEPQIIIKPTQVIKEKTKAPKLGNPRTRGARFLPDGFNRCYSKNDEIWQDGYFKKGRLWEGKVFIYDKEGILTKVKIYKEGKFLADGQL